MAGLVDFIFGGDKPDNSAQNAQLAEMKRTNDEQAAKFAEEKKRLDDQETKLAEEKAAKARARRAGGTRSLMSGTELGLPGEDDSTGTTFGPRGTA